MVNSKYLFQTKNNENKKIFIKANNDGYDATVAIATVHLDTFGHFNDDSSSILLIALSELLFCLLLFHSFVLYLIILPLSIY